MAIYTSGHLFAGVGAFSIGLRKAGFRSVWANELDADACATFKYNHSDTRLIEKDIRRLSVASDLLEPVDVLTAGFPCQPFSAAGERQGFEDDRGNLFFEIVRILQEFGGLRPRVLLFENVPNLLYGNEGSWFSRIRDEIQMAGYWFNDEHARILNTIKITGIPQDRDRLFMVALSTDHFLSNRFKFPEPNCKPGALLDYLDLGNVNDDAYFLPESNRYYKEIMASVDGKVKNSLYQYRKYYVRPATKGICPTLTANMGKGGHNVPFVIDGNKLRKLTEYECARLQGLDVSEFGFPKTVARGHRYTQMGNTVTAPVVTAIGNEIVRLLDQINVQEGAIR